MRLDSNETSSSQGESVTRGILTGLAPLVMFAVLGALAVLATILVRSLTAGEAFLSQQPMLLAILGIILLIAFIVWVAACRWALRRARAWEQSGALAQASATLWALGASAIILLLPVILALVIPQHPVHPAP